MPNPIVNRRIVLGSSEVQPPEVLRNDAVAWYRGDSLITLNGTTVSAWGDKTGNGNTATQSTEADQPDYTASAIGGRPGLTFDGGDFLEADSVASIHTGEDKALTIVSVVEPAALNTDIYWSFGNSLDDTPFFYLAIQSGDDVWRVSRRDDAGSTLVRDGGAATLNPTIVAVIFTGTQLSIRQDGAVTLSSTATDVGTLTLDQFTFGALRRTSVSNYTEGPQTEHAVFDSVLATSDVQAIESYLSKRYNIALS